MENLSPLSGPIDLDALDRYLMSDHAPADSMGVSDLDGFLAGIVVGPELISPSEWLPVIWGGEEPEFDSEDEMRTVLGTIMGRYNEIAACFDTDPESFAPVFLEGPNGEVIASDWAAGFLDAVALRPQAWTPLIEDDSARILMMPILLLDGGLDLDGESGDPAVEAQLLSETPDIVPACVAGIREFWRNYRGPVQKPPASRGRNRKTGRRGR